MTLSAIRLKNLQGRSWFQRLFHHDDHDDFVPAQLVAQLQSYVFNSAVDYGLPFLGLVILMFRFVIQTGVRLVRLSIRAVFDTTLRIAGYAMVFLFLRGIEASLLGSLSSEE